MQRGYMGQARSYVETDGRGDHVQVTINSQMEENADIIIAMIEEDPELKDELLFCDPRSSRYISYLKCKFFTLIPFGVNSVDWEKVVGRLLSQVE